MSRVRAVAAVLVQLTGFAACDTDPQYTGDSASGSGFPFLGLTPEATIDFGSVAAGTSADATLVIANAGIAALDVESVVPADALVTVDWKGPRSVVAGEYVEVSVHWAPTSFADLESTLEIFSNDMVRPHAEVALVGATPDPDIDVTPLEWDFGAVDVGTTNVMGVSIANVGAAPLTVTSLDYAASDDDLTIDDATLPLVIAPSESLDLRVSYKPTNSGVDAGTLTVASDDPDEPKATAQQTGSAVTVFDAACASLEDGFLAYWPADGDMVDAVGGHDGTVEGTVDYEPGVFGDAFEFDGRSAVKISTAVDLEYDDGEPFTYAMWVYDEGVQPYHLFGKRDSCTSGSTFDDQFVVESNHLWFGSKTCAVEVRPVPSGATWHHIVATYDGTAFSIYVDGELGGSGPTCDADDFPVLGAELRIGSSGTCGTLYRQGWVGLIDDVMLWNRTLDDDEIACVSGLGLHP